MENSYYSLYLKENDIIDERIDFISLEKLNQWLNFLEIGFNKKYKKIGSYTFFNTSNNSKVTTYTYELVK